MAKVKYIAGDSEAEEVEAFGYSFKDGKSVEVKDEDLSKFQQGNPYFEVQATVDPRKQQTPSYSTGELLAEHRGKGSYSIMQGDKEVKQGLNKADADAFNAMSDEEKAEYVK